MKFLVLLLMVSPLWAQTAHFDRMIETTKMSVNFPLLKGFNSAGACPEINLKLRSQSEKEKSFLSFFVDENNNNQFDKNESTSLFRISKKHIVRPKMKGKSDKQKLSFEIMRGSILHFTSDFKYLTGTIQADVIDLKINKIYSKCTYYVHNEIKK